MLSCCASFPVTETSELPMYLITLRYTLSGFKDPINRKD